MKHTLEDLKKMLSEISPWPWKPLFGTSTNFVQSNNNEDVATCMVVVNERGVAIIDSEKNKINSKFISLSPQIISDLVEEVEGLDKLRITLLNTVSDYIKENKRLREAIEKIKLEFNYSHTLEDIICKALEGK